MSETQELQAAGLARVETAPELEDRWGQPVKSELSTLRKAEIKAELDYQIGEIFKEDGKRYKVAPGKPLGAGFVAVDVTTLQASAEGEPRFPMPTFKAQSAADALLIQQTAYKWGNKPLDPTVQSRWDAEGLDGLVTRALSPTDDTNSLVVPVSGNAKGKAFLMVVDEKGKVKAFELTPKPPTRWQKFWRAVTARFAKKALPAPTSKLEKKVETFENGKLHDVGILGK